ncbi:MAG: glycosyltransferase family 2 protein [Anaerolineales bacterium]|nr:glycosyltransferase family 2 protein [Anaerolineales bacterium]
MISIQIWGDSAAYMWALQVLFWLGILWVAYATFGYALVLWLATRFIQRPVHKADITPAVSFLIAAHNEESVIAAKLENTLALDYPREKLEIIVMSDASTDRTNEIVEGYQEHGVILHAIPGGGGKPNAMNLTLPMTSGEVILISDADSQYAPDALRKLVRSFADERVGAVTGEEVRVPAETGGGAGEGLYVRLDNLIKRLEGQIGSMVMVNGGFVAIRRELYPVLDPTLNFDLVWAPLLQLQGYRTVYEPEARSTEVYALDTKGDFRRRLRTVLQAFYSYLSVPAALNPLRTGWYAVRLFSHRFMRWFVLPWLGVALAASLLLASTYPVYQWLLSGQALFYLLALLGWVLDHCGKRVTIFYVPFYFVYIHLAAFVAVVQALLGKRVATWEPTTRNASGAIKG